MTAELEPVIDLARRAGGALLSYFRAPADRLAQTRKGPRDLLTAADRAAEAIVLDGLRALFPGDSIWAEESGEHGGTNERKWYVDPLDGTTNFAAGYPIYSVSIALWERGAPRFAVVHAPSLAETYWAIEGSGAYLNGARLRVGDAHALGDALLATGFSYARLEMRARGLELFGALLDSCRDIRRGGCASLDLAATAAGVFTGFWEYYLAPHDVAAGALLVREAGGVVTDAAGGADYLHGRSVVAGNAAIHRRILEEITARGPAHPGPANR